MTLEPQVQLGHWLRRAARTLAGAGIASPRADAELLAGYVLQLSRGEVSARALTAATVPPERAAVFEELVAQRASRVPLQHLTGRAPFRKLELRVGPGVFVPRPETEVTAGLAIEEARRRATGGCPVQVADLCTGSGAIALALASEVPQATVVALEVDPQAHAWAAANIERLGLTARVHLRLGDVVGAGRGALADLAGQLDLVVANPPYIPPGAVPQDLEVAEHDPTVALYGGGEDGLALPAAVIAAAADLLVVGGLLVMEHAESQGPAARALAGGPRWSNVRTAADLAGRPRVLVATRAVEVRSRRESSATPTPIECDAI